MTKLEVDTFFKNEILPYLSKDKPAIREAWNNFTDSLCKNGKISKKQYETWVSKFGK